MKLIDVDEVMNQIQNIQIQNIIDDDRYRCGVLDECRFVNGFTVAQLIIELIAHVQEEGTLQLLCFLSLSRLFL